MSLVLAKQQEALLRALIDWPAQDAIKNLANYALDAGGRGLKAYQSNAHAVAQRALQAAYPVVAEMLGEESFSDLARALWHAQPPLSGDVARWGVGLAAFMEQALQLQDHPYLGDVARCEWALHRAGFAADVSPEPATLALLAQQDPARLRMDLAPGTQCLVSPWPVAALLGTHLRQQPTLAQAGQLLRERVGQNVVVWRQGMRSQWREAMPGEPALLNALQQGHSVLAAIDSAVPELDFARWLPLAVQTGLFVRVAAEGLAQ